MDLDLHPQGEERSGVERYLERMERTWGVRQLVIDSGIAVAAATGMIGHVLLLAATRGPDEHPVTRLTVLLLLGQTLPLAFRRRAPFIVATALGVLAAVYGLGSHPDPLPFGPLIAFATLISAAGRILSVALGVGTLAVALTVVGVDPSADAEDVFAVVAYIGLAWILGFHDRLRRAYRAEVEDKAARLERERDLVAERASLAERQRIARELHDIVAHHVSMIAVQSEAGAASGPGREAFDRIALTARQALAELRRLLGVLREEGPRDVEPPQPSLSEVDALVAGVRRSGLDVRLRMMDPPNGIAPGVGLCVYRVVQEALTNVVKHADARSVYIRVEHDDGAIEVEVIDDGTPSSTGEGGSGLLGLRERVSMFGGTFEGGPCDDGGFRVAARIPIEADR